MSRPKNVLWIMCDQLRYDYLGCTGHPDPEDAEYRCDGKARRAVLERLCAVADLRPLAHVVLYQPLHMRSHGSHWNGWPLRVGEPTLGDHLKKSGVRNVLVGKTHMTPDLEGLKMLGIAPDSIIGVHVAECGFEPYERDDGLHPTGRPRPKYDAYLRERGYDAANPWEHWANSGADDDGSLQNGWLLVHADKAARVAEEDSETPYMTRRAMDFIGEAEKRMGAHGACICPTSSRIGPTLRPSPTPACMAQPMCRRRCVRSRNGNAPIRYSPPIWTCVTPRNMSRDEARQKVIPTYMGLIKQIDDQMGVLMNFLEARGLLDTTMIVFTSDHGDYLGDHWMGEKDLFHDPSAKIPLIVIDPSASADATRGTVCDALVEAIDLAPTFIDYFGGKPPDHILEGHSLMPLVRGERPSHWRKVVFSEYDYCMQDVRLKLNQPIEQCRLFMVFDGRWKYIHASGFRPMLYDLLEDPQELATAAKTPPATTSSPGCNRPCSTGRCTPRVTSRPAPRRSPPMRRSNSRSKNGILIGIGTRLNCRRSGKRSVSSLLDSAQLVIL